MNELRFVYITDSHIGGDASGYQMQPRYVGHEQALFAGLARWIEQERVAFVVHGGDLTDHGLPEEIKRAEAWCASLGVPVYLCLGNHDLQQTESFNHWRASAGSILHADGDCHAVDTPLARIVMVNHHWHDGVDNRWLSDQPQRPRLDGRQEAMLDRLISETEKPVIAVTHAPLNEVPATQRGEDKPFHPPHEPYAATWRRLADAHANLVLALCGHNHVNSRGDHGTFTSCTTAAYSEPFAQVRLVTLRPDAIHVSTHELSGMLGLPPGEDRAHAWVAGTASSRHFAVSTATDVRLS